MPAWVKDEATWSKAKAAAAKSKGKSVEGLKDDDFKLVNYLYHRMTKSATLDTLQEFLQKVRQKLSDEDGSNEDEGGEELGEEQGFHEIEPGEEGGDDADKWLAQHDPKTAESAPAEVSTPAPEEKVPSKWPQPTNEELAEMRQYTRPWEQNARDRARLEAEPQVNPVKHHEGRLVEARNLAHQDHQKAYQAFQESPEYKEADPISQMEMDAKFHEDWNKKNPSFLSNAMKMHEEAHKKGESAKKLHAQAKSDQMQHVLSGGAQAGTFSPEEGLQHAGMEREDEGPSGATTDPAASFASGNREFLNQYMQNYGKKSKRPGSVEEIAAYDPGAREDVSRVLGEHPAMKDPARKKKVDAFFSQYHPLIGANAKRVIGKMGMDPKKGDVDYGLLHEAGLHGLMQAINDYDPNHPSKASFATHAGRKIQGLMQSALKTQDAIPQELRSGAKRFSQQQSTAVASPVKHTRVDKQTGKTTTEVIPATQPVKPDIATIVAKHPPEVQDRLKRIVAARPPTVRKPGGNK